MAASSKFQLMNFAPWQIVLDPPNKQLIIQLRWLVVIVVSFMLLFSGETSPTPLVQLFVLGYIASNGLLYLLDGRFFESLRLFSSLVIFDTIVVSCTLVGTGELGGDLYLAYFVVIIIAGFWRDLRWSLAFAVLLALLYSCLVVLAEQPSTYLYLRAPFLFTASLFYGYCTQVVANERALREQFEKEARRDFLTRLPNRLAYTDKVREEVGRAKRFNRPLSIAMIDIDDFKSINDSYGHSFGDVVLQKLAEELGRAVRGTDFVARLGGDEFVVLLPETDLAGAVELGNRIRSQIKANPVETAKGAVPLTVSIGISSNPLENLEAGSPINSKADQALYLAKRAGKDRVEALTQEQSEKPLSPAS